MFHDTLVSFVERWDITMKIKIKTFFQRIGINISKHKKHTYFTKWERPIFEKDVTEYETDNCKGKKIAIVMQGSVTTENHFTLETVKLYRKLYPTCKVIVSTWENQNQKEINLINDAGGILVVNKYPQVILGNNNVNLQRITSKEGIRVAKELGCEYILKTRSDQRFYASKVMTFLMNLLEKFPLQSHVKAKDRIISISTCTFRNRIYNISDMFLFGEISDIEAYFSCPEDTREHGDILEADDPISYSKQRPGEIYFASHYIESLGFDLKWTKEDSDKYVKDYFIIVDAESVDFYWPKHTDDEYRFRKYANGSLKQITFKDWINMQF